MGTTGGGATMGFVGDAFTLAGRLVSIGGLSLTGEAVEDADLASSVNKMMAGDLVSMAPIEVVVAYDAADYRDLVVYDSGVLTILYPEADTDTDPLSLVVNCFLLSKSVTELANNTRLLTTCVFQMSDSWTLSNEAPPG